MRISEIQQKIEENRTQIKNMQDSITKLLAENTMLNNQKENKLISYFHDYIELGTRYEINTWCFLTGVQTGVKKGDSRSADPNFQNGDVIEFIKKNNKSIVVKCLTKVITKVYNGVRSVETTNPNTIFRIDTISLYHFLLKDPNFAEPYKRYVSRKESLELLGI